MAVRSLVPPVLRSFWPFQSISSVLGHAGRTYPRIAVRLSRRAVQSRRRVLVHSLPKRVRLKLERRMEGASSSLVVERAWSHAREDIVWKMFIAKEMINVDRH
jgi:hypothetical protein